MKPRLDLFIECLLKRLEDYPAIQRAVDLAKQDLDAIEDRQEREMTKWDTD